MENRKSTKMKPRLLLSLTLMGALAVSTSYSLVTFAQSSMDGKKNVVMTETKPPKELDRKTLNQQGNLDQSVEGQMVFPVAMSKKQAEPFIKAAIEAFKAKNIKLPESGYWISSKYIDNDSKDVQIDWYPNSFDGIGPMNVIDDKVYFVYFTHVNLEKGTGDIQNVRTIEKDSMPTASSTVNTAPVSNQQNTDGKMVFPDAMTKEQAEPFVQAAIEAFKAKNIELPESGYWISSKYIDNDSKDVQIDWYPNSFDGIGPVNVIEDKVYTVYFTNANLDQGTGVIQHVKVIEQGDIPTASTAVK